MNVFRDYDDYEPLAWIRGFPVYATTLLVGLHVSALLGTVIASAFGFAGFIHGSSFFQAPLFCTTVRFGNG